MPQKGSLPSGLVGTCCIYYAVKELKARGAGSWWDDAPNLK